MTEYKIGKIEGKLEKSNKQKYVISQEGDDLVYYAHTVDRNGFPRHRDIRRKFELTNILGGGAISLSIFDDRLLFLGYSLDYGGVPMRVLKKFEQQLLEEYKKIYPKLKEIDIPNNEAYVKRKFPE